MAYGITEREFFSMTITEIERSIKAKKELEKRRAQFDFILADLIGRSVARVYNSENTLPTLAEAYPSLFNEQEEQEARQQAQDEMNAQKFMQFAQSFNRNLERRQIIE
jgi:hypothetical protein